MTERVELQSHATGDGTKAQHPTSSTMRRTVRCGSARDNRFPLAPLIAITSCLLAHTVAITSLSTYMGVYVQSVLGLPSQNTAGTEWCKKVLCTKWGEFSALSLLPALLPMPSREWYAVLDYRGVL